MGPTTYIVSRIHTLATVITIGLTSLICAGQATAKDDASGSQFFTLSFIELATGVSSHDFMGYWAQTAALIEENGGQDPALIAAVARLENPGSKTVAPADLSFDFLTIIRFPNQEQAEAYLAAESASPSHEEFSRHINSDVSMVAVTPQGATDPAFSTHDLAPSPGFLLLNPMTMSADPEKRARLQEYSNVALPLVRGRGVRFFAPFIPVSIIRGETSMGLMYITNWPNIDVFHEIHHNEDWLRVMPSRNVALESLSDIKGELVTVE